jgi:hypothetical protein
MAISRPFLLALLGAALLGATYFAVRNARDASTGDTAPMEQAAQPAAEPQPAGPAAEPAGVSAEEALAAAFAGDQKLESGRFSVRLSAGGGQLDRVSVELGGRFQAEGANEVPKYDIDMKLAAAGETQTVGAVSLGDRGFVTRGARAYEVPASVMTDIAEAREGIREYAGEPQPKLNVAGVDVGGFLTDPKVVGTETVDGVEVTHVKASLDPARFAQGLGQIGGGSGLPEGDYLDEAGRNPAALRRVIRRPQVDVYVGEDEILRRLAITADLNLAGDRDAKVALDTRLSEVNEPQRIEAPKTVSGGPLQAVFGRTEAAGASGLLALGGLMIQQPGLAGARAAGVNFSELSGSSAPLTDNPRRAARAVRAGRKVAILFQNPRGLDDRVMSRVMNEVGRRTEAVVLSDHVDAADRYGKLVENLGVSQTPSVVLIDRAGQGRLIEGYVDADTLAQAVADAR